MTEIRYVGNLGGKTQSRSVYMPNGLSPTLTAGMTHGNTVPYIVAEYKDKAQKNRAEAMEIDKMAEVKVIGQLNETFESQGRVYDKNGLSPTLRCFQGGGLQPKIICEKFVVMDMHNKKKISSDVCGTITAHGNASPTTCGTFGIVEQTEKQDCRVIGGLGKKKSNGGTQYYQQDRGYHGDIQPAQPAQLPGGSYNFLLEEAKKYRIRKLTPRECWRLMGYTDEDFDKAASVNSNSQLYKQAGNAIVKQVLMAIFSQLFIQNITAWNNRKAT